MLKGINLKSILITVGSVVLGMLVYEKVIAPRFDVSVSE